METVGSRKLSSEGSEGDYHDDDGLINEGEKGEAWYRGDEIASLRLSRPRDILMLWAILFSVLVMSISQAWWLASDAIYSNTSPQTSTWHESFHVLNRSVYPKEQYAFTGAGAEVTEHMFNSFDPNRGLVALPKDPNILPSKEFPWDTTREVFILSSYYSLHSLKVLWNELNELRGDRPHDPHVLHSVNVIWEDIICAARTDPIVITEVDRDVVHRVNQTRQCRDWNDLEQFSLKNSACYKRLGYRSADDDEFAEWLFCPEGSPWQAAVDRHVAAS